MTGLESDFAALRFGLGPAKEGEDWSPDGMIAALAEENLAASLAIPASPGRLTESTRLSGLRKTATVADRPAANNNFAAFLRSSYVTDVHLRIVWGATVAQPFAERLLAFWSNHFTVGAKQPVINGLDGPFEAEALLPLMGGRFADLLGAVEHHPAMLIYLDQEQSVGPNSAAGKKRGVGLNENLAREILELHTLGVHGGYNQADVTEFARIMTGWTVDRAKGVARYRAARAEPGAKTLLGRSFGDPPKASDFAEALGFIAAHPSTARHIAVKLVTHFIADEPPEDAVAAVEKSFIATDGNLLEVYRALVSLPEARMATGAKARNDRDFLIAALRAAEVPAEKLAAIPEGKKVSPLTVGALARLHQKYWSAASPAGWPEAAHEWLTPIGLAGRLDVIPRIVRETGTVSPRAFLERALGAAASDRTRRIVGQASTREEALALVLASPEFNRR